MTIVFLPPSSGAAASNDTLDDVTGRGATTANAVQVGGLNVAGAYALPTSDGSANQVLQTDGAGAISFTTISVTGGLTYKGTFDVTTASPSLANALKGDFYIIQGVATLYGQNWTDGDHLVINEDMGGSISNGKIDKIDNTDLVSSVNGLTGPVILNGANVDGDHTATNYSTANDKIESHLAGIDTKLGTLGTMSTQAANSVSITGGSVSGSTDIAITDGGTGASTAAQARINLDLEVGVDVQAYDAQLADVAGLTPTNNHVIVGDGANFTAAQLDLNKLSDVSYSAGAGIDNYVLTYDHSSTSWGAEAATGGGLANVVDDSSPELGGDLDVLTRSIVSSSNRAITLAPNGSGLVTIAGNATRGAGQIQLNCEQNTHGIKLKGPAHSAAASYTLTFPNDDGDANQVLKTDGSGNLDWVDQASGGGTIPDVVVTGDTGDVNAVFASAGNNGENERIYLINNSSSARTVTLPSTSGNSGKKFQVKRLGTANVTIAVQAGETLETTTNGTFILSAQYSSVTLVCNASGTVDGWYII